jgi:hypothetical protein
MRRTCSFARSGGRSNASKFQIAKRRRWKFGQSSEQLLGAAQLAAVGKKVRAALVFRDDENVFELLERLDASFDRALTENIGIDEVLLEIRRRCTR